MKKILVIGNGSFGMSNILETTINNNGSVTIVNKPEERITSEDKHLKIPLSYTDKNGKPFEKPISKFHK